MTTVLFWGHTIDQPAAPRPCLPPELAPAARSAISAAVGSVDDPLAVAISGAACGGDLLFCDEWLATGRPLAAYLPRPVEAFIDESVAYAGDEWVELFDRTIADIATELMEPVPNGGSDPHVRNSRRMLERVRDERPLVGILLWDGVDERPSELVGELDRAGATLVLIRPQDLG